MIAAKAFDPVLGVDIHIIQPPGPVPPVPVPHPFVGILLDPFDFAPIIGSTVSVNGLPRATAGSGGKCLPPHIPIGGVFVKPPANECDVFMGSSTVLADGEPLSFLGMPAISCHCIGMPPIPRLKKKRRVKSLVLPTTVVLAVPMGAPVLVGGPPTVSMMALGMRAGMAALGKAFKKLRKLQKASRRMKALSDKVHNAAKKAMNKLGVPPSVQNKVHRSICKTTGHPIDVATGKVFTAAVDFELPGPIPVRWERVWYSCSSYDGPLGHGWHHPYDMALRVEDHAIAVRLSDGRSCAFPAVALGEEAFNRLEGLTIQRDAAGYALSTREDLVYRFAPAANDARLFWLSEIRDRVGHVVRLSYDLDDRLRSIVDTAGRAIICQIDSAGRIAAMTLPVPDGDPLETFPAVTYEYDSDGNLAAARDAAGVPFRYAYSDHLLIEETDRNGVSFHFRYERFADGYRCIETWGPGGLYRRTLRYDPVLGRTEVSNSLGASTTYTSNDLGLVTQTVDPLGNAVLFEYEDNGNLTAETNANGLTRSLEYDGRGRLAKVTAFDGRVATISWSPDDRRQQVIDRAGAEWVAVFDEHRRLVRRIEPTGLIEERRYEGGRLAEIGDSTGRRTTFVYDAEHNLVATRESDGRQLEWTYDRLGRRIEARDESGNVLRREYDRLGRVIRVEEPDGNVRTIEYDPEGNITRVRDAARDVRLEFVGTGRLAAIHEPGRVTRYEYDTEERLVAVRDSLRGSWHLQRDAAGNVVEERTFGGRGRKFLRDPEGRLVETRWASGRRARRRYDPLGRLLEVVNGDGSRKRFEYDAAGRLTLADDGRVAVAFVRDVRGNTIEERCNDRRVAVRRSDRGSIEAIETSHGLVVRHFRDGGTRERTIVDYRSKKWEYETVRDRMGMVRRRDLPGGIVTEMARDSLGRPISRSISERGSDRSTTSYEWETAGRLRAIGRDGLQTRFERDALGRLVRETSAAPSGPLSASSENSWKILGEEGEAKRSLYESRTYDADGRLVLRLDHEGRQWRYSWRDDDLLSEVIGPERERISFEYDALGRRVSKSTPTETYTWQWFGNSPIHETVNVTSRQSAGPGGVSAWLFDRLSPVAVIRGDRWASIATDHLGTPTEAYDETGERLWSVRLSAWGERLAESGDDAVCPFRLPGQYEDRETGLYYNRWRYYDPSSRTYISPDPLGLRGGLDPYAYVPDPTTWIDPAGLWPEPSDTVPGNLHMAGNATEPSPPRPNKDIAVDDAGMVKGQTYDPDNNVFPDGKSSTVLPAESGLTGTFHQVPEGTKLPDGLAIVADGSDVGGPGPPGHHTIYPTRDMPFEEFDAKVRSLESEPKLKVTKHKKTGAITVTPCG